MEALSRRKKQLYQYEKSILIDMIILYESKLKRIREEKKDESQ